MSFRTFLPDTAATLAFGASWRHAFAPPLVVYLSGTLGAGKTTFARGVLRGMGFEGTVKSPTYALVESYTPQAGLNVHHFDLYRFASPEEWDDAGLDGLFSDNSICLIEWAQQGGSFVPAADLIFEFFAHGAGRQCQVTAPSARGKRSLDLWQQ